MASTSDQISVVPTDLTMPLQINNGEQVYSDVNNDGSNNSDSIIVRTFYKRLVEYDDKHCGSHRRPWTQDRILEVIADLKTLRVTMKKKSVDYYWMSKYEVITTANEEYLIAKKKHPTEPTVRIVPREQYFDLLFKTHASCGHGGRDKMLQDLKSKFYIPKKAVEIFVSLCPVCELKRGSGKSVASSIQNEGGQFDLIDFQSCPDGEYKWLLNYQTMVTKFTILRPLKTMSTEEVASELLMIFLTFGAPSKLQSELGKDFTACILEKIATLWPDCIVKSGENNNTEQNSRDIETLLQTWMKEKNSKNWSLGCFYVQYLNNTTSHSSLGKLPFEALLGRIPKFGFTTSFTPTPIVIPSSTTQDKPISKRLSLVTPSIAKVDKPISKRLSQVTPLIAMPDKPISNQLHPVTPSIKETDKLYSNLLPIMTPSITEADKPNSNRLPLVTPSITEANKFSNQKDQIIQQEPEENSNTSIKLEIIEADDDVEYHLNSEIDIEEKFTPLVSENESIDAYKCKSCNSNIPIICGVIDDSQGSRINVLCNVCKSEEDLELVRNKTLKRAAEQSLDAPVSKILKFHVGHSVLVDVPLTHRGPLNTKTIKGKIVDFRNGVYRVATNLGTIKNWFSRYDLQLSDTDYGDTLQSPVSLNEVVASQPPPDGILRCTCKPSVTQCQTIRCFCFKNKLLCGPKCHHNLACVNT